MPRTVRDEEIEQVFEVWRSRQARPSVCRLTEDRQDLIRARLAKGYSVEDLRILLEYAWESPEADARFWRGDNSRGRSYLDLANLLRAGKLAGRVEKARAWVERRHTEALDFAGPYRISAAPRGAATDSAREALDLALDVLADGDAEDLIRAARHDLADSLGPYRLVRSEEVPPRKVAVVDGAGSRQVGLLLGSIGGAE